MNTTPFVLMMVVALAGAVISGSRKFYRDMKEREERLP